MSSIRSGIHIIVRDQFCLLGAGSTRRITIGAIVTSPSGLPADIQGSTDGGPPNVDVARLVDKLINGCPVVFGGRMTGRRGQLFADAIHDGDGWANSALS